MKTIIGSLIGFVALPRFGGQALGEFYFGTAFQRSRSVRNSRSGKKPVGVEVYGWGFCDAYGYFGGIVK